jgi:hypothetical protein
MVGESEFDSREERIFYFSQLSGSEAHQIFCQTGTGGPFPRDKPAGAWTTHLHLLPKIQNLNYTSTFLRAIPSAVLK